MDEGGFVAFVDAIALARRIALYGVGREGLAIKGFAMRLFHLGLDVSMVGDMTTPSIGPGDLLVVSAGPGGFSTVDGLMGVARAAGARIALATANPDGSAARLADIVLVVPAQTMADDVGGASVLPMGSLFEGAEFILFEMAVLALAKRLSVDAGAMRARHTNLE
ncbi:SIS domain-containing protein [Aureimonas altamirensis]|nr:SIS domain-containing protein [Aureimonas altamirensis]MCM2502152.1 SIS domain-containing protein [Aureimonas altamirensis]